MLEQLRRNSRSFIIWVLFGIIIAVFVISFGPQADQQVSCVGRTSQAILEVDGSEVGPESWRFANNEMTRRARAMTAQGGRAPNDNQLRGAAMEALLERQLLANAATALGYEVTEDVVADIVVAEGYFYALGARIRGDGAYVTDGKPDIKQLTAMATSTFGQRSLEDFMTEQRHEVLADLMRTLIRRSVQVSTEELRSEFIHENTSATVDVVRFERSFYNGLTLSDEHVAAYLKDHEEEVKKKYEADAPKYKDSKPEVRARHIFFRKPPTVHSSKDKDAGAAPPDIAKERAEAAHKKLIAGADFATLAQELSDDKRTGKKGGDMGWRRQSSIGYGKELSDKAKELTPGQLSEVVATPSGYHILRIDDRREGDLTFDQVKSEIAEKLARDHYARQAARKDAEEALRRATAGEKLDDLFARYKAGGAGQQFTPEQLQELMRQQGIKGRSGAVIHESPNILASWSAAGDAAQLLRKQPQPGVTVPLATGAPPAKKHEKQPTFKSPEDGLPRPEKPRPAQVRKYTYVTRTLDGKLAFGKSQDAEKAIFETLTVGQLADTLFPVTILQATQAGAFAEAGDGFVLVKLLDRKDPDLTQFDKDLDNLRLRALQAKGQEAIRSWLSQRCQALLKDKKIGLDRRVLQDANDPKAAKNPYKPCQDLSSR